MKFVVYSLGCKVNQYEGQSIIARLISLGQEAFDTLQFADVYIINTCSVTSEADKKSRQMIAKALSYNENALVYVCGCSSQNSAKQYADKKNVRIIGGSSGKIDFVDSVMRDIVLCDSEKPSDFQDKTENLTTEANIAKNANGVVEIKQLPTKYEDDLKPSLTKTRGFIKIQDGCNNFCSYCIVPYLRGRSRSRSIESVVSEAEKTAKLSKEIVLTGINISAFGKDINTNLNELVAALKVVNVRKRLGSLEANVITNELLLAMKESNFCDHFHLSLQSGCDSVLKRMNRHYTIKEFMEKVELIRKVFPLAGITTDVIAGFPEETLEEHQTTIKNLKEIRFSDIHVFPYSERKGTNAARLKQVQIAERHARANEIISLKESLKKDFLMANLGRVQEVYLEEKAGDLFEGHTSNFIKAYCDFSSECLEKVTLKTLYKDGVKAEKNN